jgi:hypothetical protein
VASGCAGSGIELIMFTALAILIVLASVFSGVCGWHLLRLLGTQDAERRPETRDGPVYDLTQADVDAINRMVAAKRSVTPSQRLPARDSGGEVQGIGAGPTQDSERGSLAAVSQSHDDLKMGGCG